DHVLVVAQIRVRRERAEREPVRLPARPCSEFAHGVQADERGGRQLSGVEQNVEVGRTGKRSHAAGRRSALGKKRERVLEPRRTLDRKVWEIASHPLCSENWSWARAAETASKILV